MPWVVLRTSLVTSRANSVVNTKVFFVSFPSLALIPTTYSLFPDHYALFNSCITSSPVVPLAFTSRHPLTDALCLLSITAYPANLGFRSRRKRLLLDQTQALGGIILTTSKTLLHLPFTFTCSDTLYPPRTFVLHRLLHVRP